ncbi:hypothetical protein CL655_03395 [bacterium]|nr:hypothetical protein [bacterium]|tara:strand:+ start:6821 stop:7846 length:1026 start_codon:yes stop_codon:yes gene_type:complete
MRAVLGLGLITFGLLAAILLARTISLPDFYTTWGIFSGANTAEQHLLFTGDVFFGRAVERWQQRNPQAHPFDHLGELFSSYESVVINFESAIPKRHVPTPDYQFQFSVATSALPTIASYNVTYASIANNHSYDFGLEGFAHTQQALEGAGITPLGHPQQVDKTATEYVSLGNETVAIISLNTVGVSADLDVLQAVLTNAVSTADYSIVNIHWGTEYELLPDAIQQQLVSVFAKTGVDVVIGHHPHVVQPIERVDDTLVFYSLGNTVFDQYFSEEVQRGLMVGFGRQGKAYGVALYPITSVASPHQPQLLSGEQRERQLQLLAEVSDTALQANIEAGFVPLQ